MINPTDTNYFLVTKCDGSELMVPVIYKGGVWIFEMTTDYTVLFKYFKETDGVALRALGFLGRACHIYTSRDALDLGLPAKIVRLCDYRVVAKQKPRQGSKKTFCVFYFAEQRQLERRTMQIKLLTGINRRIIIDRRKSK